MATNGLKEAQKNLSIPSITILDSDDEEEQTTDELFEAFLKAITPFLQRKELLLLRVKFQALCPDFKCSSRFKDMLRRKVNQVHKVDVYIHFNEVLDAVIRNAAVYGNKGLKAIGKKELSDDTDSFGSQNETTQLESRQETLAGNFENMEDDSPMETTSLNQSTGSVTISDNDIQLIEVSNPANSSSSGDLQNQRSSNEKRNIGKEQLKMKRKKLIAKLEAKLKYISDEIKRLSQAELSLDEMEYGDSSYIMESRLKKRFNTIWNKICKLKGRPTSTGRVVEGSINCKTTGFPAIDRAIEKFLKKRKGFPDIFDIRNIVIRVNKKHGLGLTQGVQNDIAADILTDIGNKLQKKRKKDFEYNFGCHLTDDCLPSLDPALNNSELRQKLESNKRVNQNALDSVFEKYVHLGRVKGSKERGTDSNTTTESDSSEEESPQPSKRKMKQREHSSERDTEDESLRNKCKKKKITSENKEELSSVGISEMPVASGTDMLTKSTEFNVVEVENSPSDFENSNVASNRELPLVNDNETPSKTTTSMMETSVPEEDQPGSLEDQPGSLEAQLLNKHSDEQQPNQDLSAVDNIEKNKVKDVLPIANSSEPEKEEQLIKAPLPQVTKSKPEINTPQEKTNGFGNDDIVQIIDEESVQSHADREKTESDKSVKKQKPTINSTKLLEKIQELKKNQLSKFTVNMPPTNSLVSGSNEKVDSCHSKRKATLVRHITQNQEHPQSSTLNGVLEKQVSQQNKVNQGNDSEGQTSECVAKIPLTSKASEFSPKKETSSLQEPLKSCLASAIVQNNSVLQNNILTDTKKYGFSDTSEHRSSSPKVRISTTTSKSYLPKQIETVIILSDDEDD